ncbi:MAG: YdiU family protein, partial [Comamonas sp.]|nr:YdiU family protein [Comamonas sp.]
AAATPVIGQLLEILAANRVDHTIFWRRLSLSAQDHDYERARELFLDTAAFDRWLLTYQELSAQSGQAPDANLMRNTNPAFVLRNHVGELAIRAAQAGDFSMVQSLQQVLSQPFADHPAHSAWADFPPDWASSIAISCSS